MFSGSDSVDRALANRTLEEAAQFAVFLDAHRSILRATLEGMTDDEVRSRLVESQTTLLGLVKHATFVQVVWYQEAITGTSRTGLGQPDAVDDSFALTDGDTVESVLAGYDQACAIGREVGAIYGLDEVVTGHRMDAMTLRWIHLQVLRELAQHSGHADILREQLLSARRQPDDQRARCHRRLICRRTGERCSSAQPAAGALTTALGKRPRRGAVGERPFVRMPKANRGTAPGALKAGPSRQVRAAPCVRRLVWIS